jgi:hypothetical protein
MRIPAMGTATDKSWRLLWFGAAVVKSQATELLAMDGGSMAEVVSMGSRRFC